jgi:hypothetical protein
VGGFLTKVIQGMEALSENILEQLNTRIASGPDETGTIVIKITFVFELHGLDDANEELKRLIDEGELQ